MQPINERGAGLRINIYVQPRASRTELAGQHGDAIKLRVAAPPVEGEANRAVVQFLAKLLDVPVSAVSVIGGESSRRKVVEISGGITAADARSKLLP